VKINSLIGEIYARIGRWIGIDPSFIKLSGKLYPGGLKVVNINPDTRVINEINRITKVKVELEEQMIHNLKIIVNNDDSSQMKEFMVDNRKFELYKFLKVKTFKRIIIFHSKIVGQWPDLHDTRSGVMFDNAAEIDNISSWLMVVWSPMINKFFKVRLEGSLKARIEEDARWNIGELTKKIRKTFGLAIDCVLTDKNGKEYLQEDNAFHNRKDLSIARRVLNKKPKGGI
jgi:hypothetical protein